MAACTALALTALVLVGAARHWWPGTPLWPIYAAIALTGMARSFLSPIYNALFARVLPRDQFVRGASLGSVIFQTALVCGPALGGVLVGVGGEGLAYGVAMVLALAAGAVLFKLQVDEPGPPKESLPIFASIAQGGRFVWNHPVMLGAMALDMFSVLLGGVVAMLPAFIRTSCSMGRKVWASCVRRLRWARWRWACGWRDIRCRGTQAASCCGRWPDLDYA